MESALYGIYALVVFVSEISLVRFLIRQQLVRKYRTPTLSMKYSLFTSCYMSCLLIAISVKRTDGFFFVTLFYLRKLTYETIFFNK